MQRLRLSLLGIAVVTAVVLSACASQGAAAEALSRTSAGESQSYTASSELALSNQKKGPDEGGKDDKGKGGKQDAEKKQEGKDNNGNKNGKAKNDQANGNRAAQSAQAGPSQPGRGLGAWWRDFASQMFGNGAAGKSGGWQLGRFKEAFPFAYPPGWTVAERGDATLATGQWQGGEYVFQMSRTSKVEDKSLEDWVAGDLQHLGLTGAKVRYADAGAVRIAVVPGVSDADYDCPVAYLYLWTANPAGNNQRQARGVISQAPGSDGSPAELDAFVNAYLAEVTGDGQGSAIPASTGISVTQAPTSTPVPPAAGPTPNANPMGWQRTRFFNAFSFAYPEGWSMDRLGDTAHLQGDYQGRSYVLDLVWVRDAPGNGLEPWVRADLDDLGVNMEGLRVDYAPQGNAAQIAIVSGVKLQGYQCPVVRMYVLADNAAGGGQRAYAVTAAQVNGQACDPEALENLAYRMVQAA